MDLALQIIPTNLLEQYKLSFDKLVCQKFENLHDSELSLSSFSFYTSVSAVFSSKIEGETIDLDSFVKYKRLGVKYEPDYTRKVDDLYDAYLFARQNDLSKETLLQAHVLMTKNILQKSEQGVFRKGAIFVMTDDGKIEYVAAEPADVFSEMQKFFEDMDILLQTNLSFEEVLFFASMLHLVFVKIHPFCDGNGRSARLLEKWFLGQKLGEKAWFVPSEKYYYEQHQIYYKNIRKLGLEYNSLKYSEALPFLQMLPKSIR